MPLRLRSSRSGDIGRAVLGNARGERSTHWRKRGDSCLSFSSREPLAPLAFPITMRPILLMRLLRRRDATFYNELGFRVLIQSKPCIC